MAMSECTIATLLESIDSDEGTGPPFVKSPKEPQTQGQSDYSAKGGDNYQYDHYPQASEDERDSEIITSFEEGPSDL